MKIKAGKIVTISLSLLFAFSVTFLHAQRRTRPQSMHHTQQEEIERNKTEKVKCTYISSGHTFKGAVYMTAMGNSMKMGTSTITFKNGRFTIKFKGDQFNLKSTEKYSLWHKGEIFENFTLSGKYETIKKKGEFYLRLSGDDETFEADFPISGTGAKSFVLEIEDMTFEYSL